MKRYEGLPGAYGQAMGKAVLKKKEETAVICRTISDAQEEVERFKRVQADTVKSWTSFMQKH